MPPDSELPSPTNFRFSCPIELRFRDLDAMGHVNNAVYVTYFEITRTAYLRELAGASASEENLFELDAGSPPVENLFERYPFVVGEVVCRYLAPVVLTDQLRAYARISRFGHKSFDFEYLLVRGSAAEPVAVGTTRQICYDYAAKRSVAVPEEFRARVERFERRT